jgi:uncharacterized protein YjcR
LKVKNNQIHQLYRRGYTQKRIAQSLDISVKSVQRALTTIDSWDEFCRQFSRAHGLPRLFVMLNQDNSLERIGLMFGYSREAVRLQINKYCPPVNVAPVQH